jgi:hypothetical protein
MSERVVREAAQADLVASFEHCDDHHVGDAESADEQCHRTESDEQRRQRRVRGCSGGERVGGSADADVARVGGVGGESEHALHGSGVGGLRSHVDGDDGCHTAGSDHVGRFDEADERGAVELGCETDGLEDPRDDEPASAEPDEGGCDVEVDSELDGGVVAEHSDRVAVDGGIEEPSAFEASADGGEEVGLDGENAEPTGVCGRDLVAATNAGRDTVDGDAADGGGVLHGRDPSDHGGRLWWDGVGVVFVATPGTHRQQVRAERVDAGEQFGA